MARIGADELKNVSSKANKKSRVLETESLTLALFENEESTHSTKRKRERWERLRLEPAELAMLVKEMMNRWS